MKSINMNGFRLKRLGQGGFTAVEFMVAAVILGIIVGSLVESYNSIRLHGRP